MHCSSVLESVYSSSYRPTYHIEYSLGSQLLVVVLMVWRDLTLELIKLAELHILHEQVELP